MTLKKEIEAALNKYSAENESDTPDFVLAQFLIGCLGAFDEAVNLRERWYGRERAEWVGAAVSGNTQEEQAE